LKIVANTEVVEMEVASSLLQEICRGQVEDEKIEEIKCNINEEKSPSFLWYKGTICVHNIKELKDKIHHEAHESAYLSYPIQRKQKRSLHTCAQEVQIKCMATI
jgi:hypothetical protein